MFHFPDKVPFEAQFQPADPASFGVLDGLSGWEHGLGSEKDSLVSHVVHAKYTQAVFRLRFAPTYDVCNITRRCASHVYGHIAGFWYTHWNGGGSWWSDCDGYADCEDIGKLCASIVLIDWDKALWVCQFLRVAYRVHSEEWRATIAKSLFRAIPFFSTHRAGSITSTAALIW